MKKTYRTTAVCAALAAALLCTSCGGQSSTDTGAASSQPELSAAENTTSAPETTSAADSAAAPESSSETEPSSAAESSAEEGEEGFSVTNTPATGVNHDLESDDCDPQTFQPGDTVSGNVYNGYECFATMADEDTDNADEDAVLRFFPISTGHMFLVYASDRPEDNTAFPQMEQQWEYYDDNVTDSMTAEEKLALMPDPVMISGRIEPMPADLEALFKDWFQNYFVDGDTYEEYCLRTVYIISENG